MRINLKKNGSIVVTLILAVLLFSGIIGTSYVSAASSFENAFDLGTIANTNSSVLMRKDSLEYVGDEDCFKFTVTKTDEYLFNVTGEIGTAYLYSSNQSLLSSFIYYDTYDLKFHLTAGEVYYIKIGCGDKASVGEYSLTVSPVTVYSEDFENGEGGWKPYFNGGIMSVDSTGGVNATKALCIKHTNYTDSNFTRLIIGLEPNTTYIFEADIKGESVIAKSNDSRKSGVVLSKDDWVASEESEGTFDWKTVRVPVKSDGNGKLSLFMHLGFWGSNKYKGTAWFDNVRLKKSENNTFGTATDLTANSYGVITLDDTLNYNGDQDYFKFKVEKTGEHIINSYGELDMACLYDDNYKLLNSCVDSGNDFYNMKYYLYKGRTYYIRIKSSKSLFGKYSFTVAPTLVKIEDFEDGSKGWNKYFAGGTLSIDETGGISGSKALCIENRTYASTSFIHQFENLEPNTAYIVEAYIKGEGVEAQDSNSKIGAVLSGNSWAYSEPNEGTFSWKKIRITMKSDENGKLHLFGHLGLWGSNKYKGKIWFDNIILKKFDEIQATFDNMSVYIYNNDFYTNNVPIMTAKQLKYWAETLNKAYVAFQNLTGYTPYNGNRIDFFMCNSNEYLAFAGNPIEYNRAYTTMDLTTISSNIDNWLFAPIHASWNFDNEFFTNMKLCLIAKVTGATIDNLQGANVRKLYKSAYENDFIKGVNTYSMPGLVYKFTLIEDEIGINVFKQTFRYFQTLTSSQTPTTRVEKFEHFIQKLSDFSGKNVKNMFTTIQWNGVISYLDAQ